MQASLHRAQRAPAATAPRQRCAPARAPVSRRTLLVAAAAAQDDAVEGQPQQQPQQPQPQQKQQSYTRQRARRNAREWADESTPSTGLVTLTEKSQIAGAAACVAADFLNTPLTRVVAASSGQADKAVRTLRLAARMLNNTRREQQQQKQQQEEEGGSSSDSVLVFQPQEIWGDLVAPPQLPEGGTILYASEVSSGNKVLQRALAKRAAAAAADSAAGGSDGSEPAGTASLAAADSDSDSNYVGQRVHCGWGSGAARLAYQLVAALQQEGWAELVVVGPGEASVPVALQALSRTRKALWGKLKQDAAAVLLDEQADTPAAATAPATADAGSEGVTPAATPPRPPVRLLLMLCQKNKPASLKLAPRGA